MHRKLLWNTDLSISHMILFHTIIIDFIINSKNIPLCLITNGLLTILFKPTSNMIVLIFIITLILMIVVSNIYSEKNKEKEEQRKKLQQANKEKKRIEQEAFLADLTSKYGTPQQILITNYKLTNSIIVFPESNIIYANAQIINYKDIISSEIKEESYSFKTGNTKIVTKNSGGSTVGRAIVGGMIAGPAGAIIGGTTSTKTSQVIDTTRKHTIKHYYVLINLTDIKNPLVKID